MKNPRICVMILVGISLPTSAVHMNPVRRIIRLLQETQATVQSDDRKDAEVTHKYLCYCEKNQKRLAEEIDESNKKITELEAQAKEGSSMSAQLKQELAQHKEDRTQAQQALKSSEEMRKKEKADYEKVSADLKSNIKAIRQAIKALEGGMALLQTKLSSQLQRIVISDSLKNVDSVDIETVTKFLQGGKDNTATSGEITGILKQMLEEMEGELKETESREMSARSQFADLKIAKEREVEAATRAIEEKQSREGDLAVNLVRWKKEGEEFREALDSDADFKKELNQECTTAQHEYKQRKELRSQELVSISAAIKILNDDDALDLFKKTAGKMDDGDQYGATSGQKTQSFLQVRASKGHGDRRRRRAAARALRGAHSMRLSFLALSFQGKKAGFAALEKSLNEMVNSLVDEQKAADQKRDTCKQQLAENDKDTAVNAGQLKEITATIDSKSDSRSKMNEEFEGMMKALEAFDQAVKEATARRKQEYDEFIRVSHDNNQAIKLLEMAENRLNKFYNPKLYKPPQPEQMTEEERIYHAMGGGALVQQGDEGDAPQSAQQQDQEDQQGQDENDQDQGDQAQDQGDQQGQEQSDSAADQDQAQGQDASFLQVSQRAAPEKGVKYQKSEKNAGVITLLRNLRSSIKSEQREVETDEKQSEADYMKFMEESKKKRKTDSQAITQKKKDIATMEEDISSDKEQQDGFVELGNDLKQTLMQLKEDCDFLLKNYEAQKTARANEVEATKKSIAVLKGADFGEAN